MYSHRMPGAPAAAMRRTSPSSYSADTLPRAAQDQSGSQMKYTLDTQPGSTSMTEMPTRAPSTRYSTW